MPKDKKIQGYDQWEIEQAARTLIEAQQLRTNKTLFKLAQVEVRSQMEAAQAALVPSAKKVKKRASSTFMKM